MAKVELTRFAAVRAILRSRWPQLALQAVLLGGLLFTILSGLLGTPVGSHNFGIVYVWIAWWGSLILVLIPLLGRGWCSVCPIPLPGEWLQRGAVHGPSGKGIGLNLRWPKRLRNIWLQNAAFGLVAVLSAVILTQPAATAWVLGLMLAAALALSLVFERRAFCRYLCPVGGFIGLYSQLAPVELRVKDRAICAGHTEKTCYTGNGEGYGCPWQVFPASLAKNTACGLCMECLRTCPYDNLALNLRPPGADLMQPRGRRLDEAFKSFVMLGSAVVYSGVMLGPWGGLKAAAYGVGSPAWLGYALAVLALAFGLLPGSFYLTVLAGGAIRRSMATARRAFVPLAYGLVPLGLAAWVAFSLSFVFANASYLGPALADPLGGGWNLAGLAGVSWRPLMSGLVPWMQVGALAGGLAWSSGATRRIAVQTGYPAPGAPIAFSAALTMALLWLLLG